MAARTLGSRACGCSRMIARRVPVSGRGSGAIRRPRTIRRRRRVSWVPYKTNRYRKAGSRRVKSDMEATEQVRRATFPRLLLEHARTRGNRPATREKDLGIWQTWTWSQVAANVRALACGLAAQGFRRGMHLAIIGDNRPRLYWAMTAAQALGGIPVPMYQDAPAAEFVYVLNDAEIGYALAEDQEQVDKVLEAK